MGARILLFCFFHLNLSKPPREAGASKTTALRYRLSSGARSAIDSLKRDPDRVIMRGQEASAGFDVNLLFSLLRFGTLWHHERQHALLKARADLVRINVCR